MMALTYYTLVGKESFRTNDPFFGGVYRVLVLDLVAVVDVLVLIPCQ
jgi:hypothetical protein